jgi:hypothetical protein
MCLGGGPDSVSACFVQAEPIILARLGLFPLEIQQAVPKPAKAA